MVKREYKVDAVGRPQNYNTRAIFNAKVKDIYFTFCDIATSMPHGFSPKTLGNV